MDLDDLPRHRELIRRSWAAIAASDKLVATGIVRIHESERLLGAIQGGRIIQNTAEHPILRALATSVLHYRQLPGLERLGEV